MTERLRGKHYWLTACACAEKYDLGRLGVCAQENMTGWLGVRDLKYDWECARENMTGWLGVCAGKYEYDLLAMFLRGKI